jgi:hypothetical protein
MRPFLAWLRKATKNTLAPTRRPSRTRLAVEALEDRVVLSPFVVINNFDSGPGSLRQAMLDANANQGHVTIDFKIPTTLGNPVSIWVSTPLPPIKFDSVVLDGTTENGYAGKPLVWLEAPYRNTAAGLTISRASNCDIKGLAISAGNGAGICIDGGSDNVVESDWLGFASGRALYPNKDGVDLINNASQNRIGGTTAAARNVISGNLRDGILIDSYCHFNVVEGDYIGTDPTGATSLGNQRHGVTVNGTNNQIGGSISGTRNVISGNFLYGVEIFGAGTVVQGNLIGTDVTGSKVLGNAAGGVQTGWFNVSGVVIGGASSVSNGKLAGAGNVISGNGNGVVLHEANQVLVQGNFIGTDLTGTHPLGNQEDGILIDGGSNNLIGGGSPGLGNVVAANGWNGVDISSFGIGNYACFVNHVQGNWIGTNKTGTAKLGNQRNGVLIISDPLATNISFDNEIGGSTPFLNSSAPRGPVPAGVGNTIAFNALDGVKVEGSQVVHTPIRGNSIYGNGGLGIELQNQPLYTPVLVYAQSQSGQVIFFIRDPTGVAPLVIDFYASSPSDSSSGHAQGRRYLGSRVVVNPTPLIGSNKFSFYATNFAKGDIITATATDSWGNTTEFSTGVTAW